MKPACGLASAAAAPLSRLATVLLPAPAPPTTATCSGTGGWSSRQRADAVAHQGRRQAQLPGRARLVGLLAAVLLQPAEVVGQLARQRCAVSVSMIVVHVSLVGCGRGTRPHREA